MKRLDAGARCLPYAIAICCLLARANIAALAQTLAGHGVITHGSRARREVCLTFDACQTAKPAGYDARIVSILERTHTAATFMLCGRWMETHVAETRHLAANPQFEIGSHSYIHPHMTRVPESRDIDELTKTQQIMLDVAGRRGTLFRPPYGEYDARLIQTAANLGLRTITWEVVTGDPDKLVTANDIVRTVLHKTKPGSIIIMHVNGRGWHSAEALPAVIAGLRKRGYTFVTMSRLMN